MLKAENIHHVLKQHNPEKLFYEERHIVWFWLRLERISFASFYHEICILNNSQYLNGTPHSMAKRNLNN